MTSHGRVIIVSNRLPFTVHANDDRITLTTAAGGLANGLRAFHEAADSLWVGWPGDASSIPRSRRAAVTRHLHDRRIVPVHLGHAEAKAYYDGVCNGVIWPLFHYLTDRLPLDPGEWSAYCEVNERFAAAVAREYRDGDVVWIHDYHLLLVPGLLRAHLRGAAIGFFLHIPFPAADVFRIIPWRREILAGLLGANVIGFHTADYASHFIDAVRSLTALEIADNKVYANDHPVEIGVYPMGVDAASFTRMADDADVLAEYRGIASSHQHILLGVDRLDYTKGILRRLLAYERLLRDNPDMRGRVRLIQVAVPSRGCVASYQRFRQELDELVGRINGDHGTLEWTPIRYLHQAVSRKQLVALYRLADVMLVTPLRDGMNLVAKEFIASRADGDGVLVLSEFAGAASELPEAVSVNPYDIDELTARMKGALTMEMPERRQRMAALRQRVAATDVYWWAATFLRDVEDAAFGNHCPTAARAYDSRLVTDSLSVVIPSALTLM
ncbi:MAG TPA: bifunctional alpha,alpha-trehalose-phosphate synthase (UDP-forming)/trehalose-phosphatase [Vicinamibacterales bacterium]|jgi:trehalose 6-phosphate synthase/phosphatase|nr:bifunctional alpha,alpha-trehalose-phosphate synthase (UDP-forming)/trehalose-phosphatase [Vicinamibacterales bacterium]